MLRFTVVVILETLGLLALAPKKALAQFQDGHDAMVVDPADRAVYVARADQALAVGNLTGRWEADGTFDRLNGPFAIAPVQRELMPIIYAGRMTLVADNKTLYRRDAAGAWVGTASHLLPGDPLGCGGDSKGRCALFSVVPDGNGIQDLLVIGPTGAQIRYPTLDSYRGPEGLETKLDLNSIVFAMLYHSEYIWGPDRQQMLVTDANFGSDKHQLGYSAYSTAGQEKRIVSSAEPIGSLTLQNLTPLGDGVYIVVNDFPIDDASVRKTNTVQIFAVEAPFSKTPRGVQIFKSDQYDTGLALGIAHSGEYVYLRHGHGQDGQLAAFHAPSKDVADIGPCASSASSPLVAIESQKGSRAYWLACGKEIYGLRDGRVVQRFTASSTVTSGTALPAATGDGDEVVVTELGGGLERFGADGSQQRIGADGAGSILRPALKASWLTAMGQLCGVAEDAQAVIGCERGRNWQRGGYEMPAPYAVWHTPDAEWTLSLSHAETLVYRRAIAAPESEWRRIQAFATEAPPPFDKRAARFIAQGPTQVAVQDAAGQYWRWDGRGFTQSYPHAFVLSTLQPVIGEDGHLYDACPVQAGASLPLVCAYSADGVLHPLEGREGITASAKLIPLKRGVLAQQNRDAMVIRGTRTIDLSRLQGEFARGKDDYGMVQGPALGDGSMLLAGPKGDKIYRYDGHGVTLFQTLTFGDDSRTNDRMQLDGQIWQGADGIWRLSSQADGRGFIYAKNPMQLAWSSGAVKTGSQILAAASLQQQTWLATPHGLWSCASGKGTPLSLRTSVLPVTKGCTQRWALPFVTKLKATATSLVMLQGNRILELTPSTDPSGQGDRLEVLSAVDVPMATARALGHTVNYGFDVVSFVEGDHLVLRSGQPAVKLELPLPAGLTSTQVQATADRWLCSDAGLYWLDQAQAWQAVPGAEACVGMAAAGGQVLALSQNGARLCQQGACAESVGLPKAYLDDTAVGTLDSGVGTAGSFGLVMGQALYRFGQTGFAEITPTYAKGSALLMAASDLNNGFVSLRTGGVLAPPTDPTAASAWRHLRLQ